MVLGPVGYRDRTVAGLRRALLPRRSRDKIGRAAARDDNAVTVQELVDCKGIHDALHRYARGVDRVDDELIASVFHEDARIYSPRGVLGPGEFIAWYLAQPRRAISQHFISNVTVTWEGAVARTESYFWAVTGSEAGLTLRTSTGRYVDRFEQRGSGWRIMIRTILPEWSRVSDVSEGTLPAAAARHRGSRDRADPSYLGSDDLLRWLTA
jgi:hypothetical protein